MLVNVQLSPLEAIEEYTGLKRGSIKANFYGDCAMIPDSSELDVVEKKLHILDVCFLGPPTIQGVGIIIVIPFTYRRITLYYRVKQDTQDAKI